jgi:ribosomal protein S17E
MDKFMEDFEENMKHVAHVYELEYKI